MKLHTKNKCTDYKTNNLQSTSPGFRGPLLHGNCAAVGWLSEN